MECSSLSFIVETSGNRLDAYLADRAPDVSRARVQQLIRDGQVLVNRKQEKAGYRVKTGESITMTLPPPVTAMGVAAENIPLTVVYQDADLLVINKPVGLVVHPGAGNWTGTLVNALLFHVHDLSGIGGELRPGIVHRLDKDTSGLMLVAKNDVAHRALSAMIEQRAVKREYLALVWGVVERDTFTIDAPIGRHPTERQRMAVLAGEETRGARRHAVTHFTVREHLPHATALEARLETGRTHQVRVHLAHAGYPVVGDPVYGGRASPRTGALPPAQRVSVTALPGQALHAFRLSFPHPRTGEELSFTAPPPLLFQQAWDALREQSK